MIDCVYFFVVTVATDGASDSEVRKSTMLFFLVGRFVPCSQVVFGFKIIGKQKNSTPKLSRECYEFDAGQTNFPINRNSTEVR